MKGESREAKGHETTGGGRTWYGKRKTLTPLLKREKISLNDCINDAFIVKVQTFNIAIAHKDSMLLRRGKDRKFRDLCLLIKSMTRGR